VNQQKTLEVAELGHREVAGEHRLHAFLTADTHTDVGRCRQQQHVIKWKYYRLQVALQEIRKRVNLPETVVKVIRRRRLTWFGHVSRMSGDRLPTRALHCYIPGRRSRGRPCKKWINNIQEDLNHLQLNMKEAIDIVRDRQE